MQNNYMDEDAFFRRRELIRQTGPKVVASKMASCNPRKTPVDNIPGDAKSYVHHLLPYHRLNKIKQVIIYARVSSYTQEQTKNLETQIKILREHHEKRGIEVVGCYSESGSGRAKFFGHRQKLINVPVL